MESAYKFLCEVVSANSGDIPHWAPAVAPLHYTTLTPTPCLATPSPRRCCHNHKCVLGRQRDTKDINSDKYYYYQGMAILASINIIIIIIFLAYSGAGSNWHQALRVPMPGSSIRTQPTQVVGTQRECKQTASVHRSNHCL